MSHKQSEELKQKIQSEKQRMEREQEIRVPYHKPKQHTLKEFMARRTLKKPQIDKSDGQKPMSSILQLKLVGQNIESFAQKMKEREEEAIEFFKSESESDDEELELTEEKENISANQDLGMTEALMKKEEKQDELMPEELKVNPVELEIVNEESSVVEPELSPLDEENRIAFDVPDTSNAIELEPPEELVNAEVPTEKVPEDSNLNQLREKYNNMNTDDDVKPKLSFPTLKTLEEMGSNNFVIDLESGAIEPRKLSGAEKLFQRYLKTVQKPKHKDSVCMNIISIENGKLENQKIEVKLEKEVELDHNRPGLSREKLRDSIRQKIYEQRIVKIKEKIVKQEPSELEPEDKDDCSNAEKESLLSDEEGSEDEEVEEDDIEDEEEEDNETPRKSKPKCTFVDDEVESF